MSEIKPIKSLGQHPEGGEIEVMPSMYGRPYVRHNSINVTIPETIQPEAITLEQAVELLNTKKEGIKPIKSLGQHPDGGEIEVMPSMYGKPYVRYNSINVTIPQHIQPESITLEQAVELLNINKGGIQPIKSLGQHPDGGEIEVMPSMYGKPFVKHNNTNVTIPETIQPDAITLEQAVELLKTNKGGIQPIKSLGQHPDGGEIVVMPSMYDKPFIRHNGLNITIPPHIQPNAITFEQALELIASKAKT